MMSNHGSATKSGYLSRGRDPRPGTREKLLAAAGSVFADKGADATGNEICQRANVNSAAINYYFGGIDGLYEAVLREASSLCPSPDATAATADQSNDPRQLLRGIIGQLISVLTSPPPDAWIVRLLMREFLAPSPAFERLSLDAQALSQARLLKTIVARIMGLPVDHQAVAQGCICVLAPLQLMIIGQRGVLDRMYPEMDVGAENTETLVERALAYAVGGLKALAKVEAGRPKPTRRR